MTKNEFKYHVTNRISEGNNPNLFIKPAIDILGEVEAKAFLGNVNLKPKVGDELEKLIKQLGLRGTKECGCQCFINTMNTWGVVNCVKNIEIIIGHVKKQRTLFGVLKASIMSIRSGMIGRLGIVSPIRNLIWLAIENSVKN